MLKGYGSCALDFPGKGAKLFAIMDNYLNFPNGFLNGEKNMKRKTVLSMAVLLLACLALPMAAAAADPTCPDPIISVSGTGEILTVPDTGLVTLGVQTENADVKAAQDENARIMGGMISALEGAGIAREDIQTVSYTVYPVYEDSSLPFGQKIRYYQVTSMVQVTVRDVTRTGEIIDTGVNNGANQVSSVAFTLSPEKERSLRAQALGRAVANARADADVTAAAVGVGIRGVQSVSVGAVYIPVAYDNRFAGAEMKSAPSPTPIEAGQITVTAQVSISYLIG